MSKTSWNKDKVVEKKQPVNRIPGKARFSSKKEIIETAIESTQIIQHIHEVSKAMGIDLTDPVQAAQAFNRLLQVIPIETLESVCKKASNKLETVDLPEAIAEKLFDNQVDRQYKGYDKLISNKASVKVDVNAGRKVVIVRPD